MKGLGIQEVPKRALVFISHYIIASPCQAHKCLHGYIHVYVLFVE